MNDQFNWNRRTIPKRPVPPAELFPEALSGYLESVNEYKVVYRFPFDVPYARPNEEVLTRLRLTIELGISMVPGSDYTVTFYYY